MECKRCGNKDLNYFYKGHKGYYCRKCVRFKRLLLEDEITNIDYEISKEAGEYRFKYPLTSYQEEVSIKCLEYLNKGFDILLHCVCGAGKTEIVVKSIGNYLDRGLKVAYGISRKEVVKELYERFKEIFPYAKVVSLYEGHLCETKGDLIVCTTHQLYRYNKNFDLLILDEVDAYPLSGNKELMNIAINSCRGNIVFSSATVNDFLNSYIKKRNIKELNLYVRPSLKPLIVPKNIYGPSVFLYVYLFILIKKMTNQTIIFVTSKKQCRYLYYVYRLFFNCTYVYSDLNDRDKNINDFKDKKYKYIFSTTVLERGITIKDINVIVLNINNNVFSEESIVQMLGRVGRSIDNPYGEAYVLSNKFSKEIRKAKEEIITANKKYEMSLL